MVRWAAYMALWALTGSPMQVDGPVAVFDLVDETGKLSTLSVKKISARARHRFVRRGVRLVPHATVKARLDRMAKQGISCEGLACLTEVAQAVEAGALFRARVARVEGACVVFAGIHRLTEPPLVRTASVAGGCEVHQVRRSVSLAVDEILPR